MKAKLDKQFVKFLEVLALMLSYTNFMKDILSHKRRLEEFKTIALTKKCIVILQKRLPSKLEDLGSFYIHYTID